MKELEKVIANIEQLIVEKKIDKAELLQQLSDAGLPKSSEPQTTPFKKLLVQNMKKIVTPQQHEKIIPFEIRDIDQYIEGLMPGELTVVSGRPGMGKTQFLVSTAFNISKTTPVLFCSLQHNQELITNRFIACGSGFPVFRLTPQRLQGKYMTFFMAAERELGKAHLFVNDSYTNNIHTFVDHCKKMIAEHGIKVLMIDGFEYMNHYNILNSENNRDQELSAILLGLKQLANETNISIIISTELYRGPETRGGKMEPRLSDLRSCSLLEYLADKIMLLYRPDYYGIHFDDEGDGLPCNFDDEGDDLPSNLVEIFVAKNNNGKRCRLRIKRDEYFTRYMNLNDATSDFISTIEEMF